MFGKKKARGSGKDEDAAKAELTKPARLVATLTSPKTAKRAIAVAKLAGPALAPVVLRAAAGTRSFLDEQRARRLGVTAAEVGAFRGPTGPTGARISGLLTSIEDLQARKRGDLQIARFADVSKTRLADLTAATQASASMPSGRRRTVLRAVGRELDQMGADLMTYLVGDSAA